MVSSSWPLSIDHPFQAMNMDTLILYNSDMIQVVVHHTSLSYFDTSASAWSWKWDIQDDKLF